VGGVGAKAVERKRVPQVHRFNQQQATRRQPVDAGLKQRCDVLGGQVFDDLEQRDGGVGLRAVLQVRERVGLQRLQADSLTALDLGCALVNANRLYGVLAQKLKELTSAASDVKHRAGWQVLGRWRRGAVAGMPRLLQQRQVGLVLLVKDGAVIAADFAVISVESLRSLMGTELRQRPTNPRLGALQPFGRSCVQCKRQLRVWQQLVQGFERVQTLASQRLTSIQLRLQFTKTLLQGGQGLVQLRLQLAEPLL